MSGTATIRLLPLGAQFAVAHNSALREPLGSFGMEFPCGGEGWCGSCKVRVLEGALPVTPEDRSALTEQELAAGWRLGCRAHATGHLTLEASQWVTPILADFERMPPSAQPGLGIAIDLGTTTVVAHLLDLLNLAGATIGEVEHVYLAGAFGNYIRISSACRVGLLEVAAEKVTPAGNTALRGAKLVLLVPGIDNNVSVTHIGLESHPAFQDTFVDCIAFPA